MRYNKLGHTDIDVSVICLGTMTWGEQNTEAEGHAQMDYALDRGVNFWDTAELYAIPPRAETYGRTEEIIGTWFEKTGRRSDVILASKVAGRAGRLPYMRPHLHGGETRLDRQSILEACDASLKRLKTDYIDLYQLHWPERETTSFDSVTYSHNPEQDGFPIEESLRALEELVQAGKVRYVGVSNESAWGVMEFLRLAETAGLPRIVSIQNPYNLLKREYEYGLAEVSCRTGVGLLAYSPLAMGTLSGKYLDGARPEGARLTLFNEYFPRYQSDRAVETIRKYVDVARRHGLDPAQLANTFVNTRQFTTANIIGATNLDQLKTAIDTGDMTLSDDVLTDIEAIHKETPIGY
ncbi:MAG: NADP(H)-dependent aldo-keto reductase [Alphaproteobacteria bacterium]|nr:NADP(H)-dependent aldo-keto reductase [Alphaproteobacteria bacterium]